MSAPATAALADPSLAAQMTVGPLEVRGGALKDDIAGLAEINRYLFASSEERIEIAAGRA